MTSVTTWTGWEATALRRALRMSLTGFAEHLGAARRTVAKWSSRGQDIQLRRAYRIAPEEIRSRPAAHRIVGSLATRSSGRMRDDVVDFATTAGIRV